jgi:hypothetical protein
VIDPYNALVKTFDGVVLFAIVPLPELVAVVNPLP